jgi:hypothetical protein
MLTVKRYFVGAILGLASLFFLSYTAQAYYAEYTVNSVINAAWNYYDTPYATLASDQGTTHFTSVDPNLTVPANALAATTGKTNWTYTSAGNLWTGPSTIYLSVTLPSAGTYKIAPVSGGFNYDSFAWDSAAPYYNQYQWLLQIVQEYDAATHNHSQITLGNTSTYSSAAAAFAAVSGLSTYLTVSGPTTLYFYIFDNNTIDNAGNLTFSISSVPLPSSLLLVLGGLPAMALFRVRRFFSKG